MRLLVTRPQPQAADWVARLSATGFEAAALPLLRTVASEEPAAPAAREAVARCDGVVFVSPAAVTHFFEAARGVWPWAAGRWAAAPGPGTARCLAAAGVPAQCIVQPAADADQFDSEALWQQLRLHVRPGAAVVIVRGDGGRDWLAQALAAAGAQVRFVQAYRRMPPAPTPEERVVLDEALREPASHLWLFSSAEAIGHLESIAPGADWSAALALATHPRIEARARQLGCSRVWTSRPSFDAVVAAARAVAGTP
ncbi:uroporphyrinogen-III synthase [Aquincola sp. MAHUQ-54]|uniref:Uroporphyrinogen-III synthase n=1 Tax=Aquincola agrisoli TaxID=3119538 RepID=A0AAW9Q2N3_9BURK